MLNLKVILCDFTGRTPAYSSSLANSLKLLLGDGLTELIGPSRDFTVKKYSIYWILGIVRRGVLYMIYWLYILFSRPAIIHFQWLVVYQSIRLEKYLIIFARRKHRIVYTVHNIYPHNRPELVERYLILYSVCDVLLVHTESTRQELLRLAPELESKVHIQNHGSILIEPNLDNVIRKIEGKLNLLMFGSISEYKNQEEFLMAAKVFKDRNDISFTLIGKPANSTYFNTLKEKGLLSLPNVKYHLDWVEDNLLKEHIMDSHVIVLPYLNISQSGVLVTALSSSRMCLASSLESFRETLKNDQKQLYNNNEKSGLEKKIKGLIESPNQIMNISERNTVLAMENHSWINISVRLVNHIYCR